VPEVQEGRLRRNSVRQRREWSGISVADRKARGIRAEAALRGKDV